MSDKDGLKDYDLKTVEYTEDKTELLIYNYMKHNHDKIRNESSFMLDGFRLDKVDNHYELSLTITTTSYGYILKKAGKIKMPESQLIELRDILLFEK